MAQRQTIVAWVIVGFSAGVCGCGPGVDTSFDPAKPPVALRQDNLTVNPSAGPVTYVTVRNLRPVPYEGKLSVTFPAEWKASPIERAIALEPREIKRVPVAIEKAVDLAANRYGFEITAVGGGHTVRSKQTVVCASAPYYKPVIDGEIAEWRDSIPIGFVTGGRKTVVRTYWNRRNFCLCVEVQEEALTPYAGGKAPFDAVQFAIAPRKVTTPASPGARAGRYEFLVAQSPGGARCFQLIAPGAKLAEAARARPIAPLAFEAAKVAVKRAGDVTRYEIAIPFKSLATMRPTTGREFHFSLLVHDAGGPLRDLGSVMNLAETDRKPLAWCLWPGGSRPERPPFDSMIEWGFCSSIH